MLILPIFSPCVSHVLRLELALLFLLRDPFVLITSFLCFSLGCSAIFPRSTNPLIMGGAACSRPGRALAGPSPVGGR